MAERAIKKPGPDHPISIAPVEGRVRVLWRGKVLADATHALEMREGSYPPVYYLPPDEVAMEALERTAHSTYCPYKGEASYYSLVDPEGGIDNAVWVYERPYEAVARIAGHLAFYPNKVDAIERV